MTRDGFTLCLEKSGFVSISITEVSHDFIFSSGHDLIEGLVDNPFFKSTHTELGLERIEQLAALFFEAQSTRAFLENPLRFTGTAFLARARKISDFDKIYT